MENIVFYFSGTGNSLKVAKAIIQEFGNGELVSMAKLEKYNIINHYDTIGFVFPLYFAGLPKIVNKFISKLIFDNNKNAYYYAIITFGGRFADNGISQLNELLIENHGIKLSYGEKIKIFSNYIIEFDMAKDISGNMRRSDKELLKIISQIKNREVKNIKKSDRSLNLLNEDFVKNVSIMDKNYMVNNNCIGCGVCKEVCPVKNIILIDNKPQFNNNCEQCMACIQYCPQKAINYGNKTQNRRRYTNPEIDYKELSKYNNK
jgi:ferredoxin/flavodoxin